MFSIGNYIVLKYVISIYTFRVNYNVLNKISETEPK